jgi:2-amino-4-hydroxy-6-hydroxymethyldihydropteridine diphosphokinase
MKHVAFIGIGSNIGDKVERCRNAISSVLAFDNHRLLARSSLYKTQPLGYTAQDWFVNGVIKIETDLQAQELLRSLKALESSLGRQETFRWGPRTIDLDLLFFDDEQIHSEELEIPHPRLHDRQFVLIPLAEIEPHLVHPVFKKTIQEILDRLRKDQGVKKLPANERP